MKKDSKKKLKEDAPAMSMGTSSSAAGSGAIDTVDRPLRKRVLKRFRSIGKKNG